MKYEQNKICWLDVKMNERDESAMENGVINSNIFLMIVSEIYFTRPFCIKEIEWAVKYKKPIVIVIDVKLKNKIGELLQLCPDHLRKIGSINFIDLNRGDNEYWKLGMKKIVFAIPKVLENIDLETGRKLKEMEKQYRLPGDKLFESSDYRDALKCYLKWKEELISFYNNTKNESSIELMDCMVKLGETYEKAGEYDLSMKCLNTILPTQIKELGMDNVDVAKTYALMGGTCSRMSKYDLAMEYCMKSLNIRLKVLDEGHVDVGDSYHKIGVVYYDKAEYDKALEYYNKSLDIRINKLGKDHTDVATSYNNIANVYYSQNKYDEALEYYNKSLDIRINKLGKDHTDVAASYNNIGLVYKSQNKYDEALE